MRFVGEPIGVATAVLVASITATTKGMYDTLRSLAGANAMGNMSTAGAFAVIAHASMHRKPKYCSEHQRRSTTE